MMMRRIFDAVVAASALVLLSPIVVLLAAAIYLQDFHSPFYFSLRAARGDGSFVMVKFRSMIINADRAGGTSTAASDPRVTPLGSLVRTFKLDEVLQLWNVLKGDMSLVGPRPQTLADRALYTAEEERMLAARPGITDAASIVFADEGEILRGSSDPDLLYQQIIRPWKSRLALLNLDHTDLGTTLRILWLTALALVSRDAALRGIEDLLRRWKADDLVLDMARRRRELLPYPPPGATQVVVSYR